MDVSVPEAFARRGTAMDIIVLVQMYERLGVAGRTQVFTAAAEEVAKLRIAGLKDEQGSQIELHDWMTALADETRPHGDGAAQLMTFVRGFVLDADEIFFADGLLPMALGPSEDELILGQQILDSYDLAKSQADSVVYTPDAAECLGINPNKRDFKVFTDEEGWKFDEDAWNDETNRQCVLECASFVASWREQFFQALIGGVQPRLPGQRR